MRSPLAPEAGGLSGRPLFAASTRILAQTYLRAEGQFPLIGVGGVDGADTAMAKIEAGATLLQLYSALVYSGPVLIDQIKSGLLERVGEAASLAGLVGGKAASLAHEKP